MSYYPLFLDIKKKTCVVVGGGRVAERKVLALLKPGALVTVISPRLTEKLKDLAKKKKIRHIRRNFKPGDLEDAIIAMSATNSKNVNKTVFAEAIKSNTLVNVVDSPELSSFIVPSVVERGGLKIAVSTSGKSPLLSKTLRKKLERDFPKEYEGFIEILGAARKKLLKEGLKNDKKDRIIRDLIDSPILEWIKAGSKAKINEHLKKVLGEKSTLTGLGVRLRKN